MRLYKYVRPERLDDVLSKLELRFTQPEEFNDPFEVVPNVAEVLLPEHEDSYLATFMPDARRMYDESLEGALKSYGLTFADLDALLEQHGVAGCARDFLTPANVGATLLAMMKAAFPRLLDAQRPTFGRNLQKRFGTMFGILSASEVPSSLLMWAHYGDCHRGFALELDSEHPFFNRPEALGVIGRLLKVVYAVERPGITLWNPSITIEQHAENIIKATLLTKSSDWAYEREWRMILPLDNPTAHPHRVAGNLHLFQVPPNAITAIILGARSSPDLERRSLAILAGNSQLSHVHVGRAKTSDARFEVTVEM